MMPCHDVMVFYLELSVDVEFIVYYLEKGVLVIMWEKEYDTCCLLRSTVPKLNPKVLFRELNNTFLNLFQNCWSHETFNSRHMASVMRKGTLGHMQKV